MIIMARKNSTYQFVAMLLQFNFNVKVNRTTEGDDIPDVLEVHSQKYKESYTMSVYGSMDDSGTFTLPVEEMKKEICDLMSVVNYSDGTVVIYKREFFLKNIKGLIKDGAVVKLGNGDWQIYPEALSGLFKLHTTMSDETIDFSLWEDEGRMVYMMQRIQFNHNRDKI